MTFTENEVNEAMDVIKGFYENERRIVLNIISKLSFIYIPSHFEPTLRLVYLIEYIKSCPDQLLAIKYAEWAKEMIDKTIEDWRG